MLKKVRTCFILTMQTIIEATSLFFVMWSQKLIMN